MPTAVKFKWLNAGKETILGDLPLAGNREILELQKGRTKYISAMSKRGAILLSLSALAAKRMIKSEGVEQACDAWNATIDAEFGGNPGLKIPLDNFPSALQAWINNFVLRNYGTDDEEEAMTRIDSAARDLAKEMEGSDAESLIQGEMDTQLTILYWRLRASGFNKITLPHGDETLSFKRDDKLSDLQLLSEVVTHEDTKQLIAPTTVDSELDMEELMPLSVADVMGKSRSNSTGATASAVNTDT